MWGISPFLHYGIVYIMCLKSVKPHNECVLQPYICRFYGMSHTILSRTQTQRTVGRAFVLDIHYSVYERTFIAVVNGTLQYYFGQKVKKCIHVCLRIYFYRNKQSVIRSQTNCLHFVGFEVTQL
jgi:hypothetical protein